MLSFLYVSNFSGSTKIYISSGEDEVVEKIPTSARESSWKECYQPRSMAVRYLDVYALADFYMVGELKQTAKTYFSLDLNESVPSAELVDIIHWV